MSYELTSYELPPDYNFVDQDGIESGELVTLLEEVVATTDLDDIRYYPPPNRLIGQAKAVSHDEVNRMALGVRDDEGKLVGYGSATIDTDEKHATADCLIVRKIDRDRGIGRALVNAGLGQLNSSGIETVSFEPFGKIHRLMPYLVEKQGFRYVPEDHELCSHRTAFQWLNESIPGSKEATNEPAGVENEALSQPIDDAEMKDFRDIVHQLVENCVKQTNLGSRAKINSNGAVFYFEKAGLELQVTQTVLKDYSVWQVVEIGDELIPSPYGELISTRRTYQVWSSGTTKKGPKEVAIYTEELERRGQDGAMRPFIEPETSGRPPGFNRERYPRILKTLRRLSPEHLTDAVEF